MVAGRYVALELSPGLHRVELPATALGLPAPPAYTELTFRKGRRGFTVLALAGRTQAQELSSWLRALGALAVAPAAGKEPKLQATLQRLPDTMAFLAPLLQVEVIGLGSDGSAFLVARATKAKLQEALRHLEALRVPENAVPELTARQAELLQFCADQGYYDIPRRTDLRALAQELGISPTALSRALRRAEARILSAYVERLRHSLPARKPAKRAKQA
jgi:DNA-binding MarR family transcriptional regulator